MITVTPAKKDGAAGRCDDGGDRRRALLQPFVETVAEAREDEEGVVDSHPEADHQGELRREVRVEQTWVPRVIR